MKTRLLIAITFLMIACSHLNEHHQKKSSALSQRQASDQKSIYPGTNYIAGLSPGFQINIPTSEVPTDGQASDSLTVLYVQGIKTRNADVKVMRMSRNEAFSKLGVPDTIICSTTQRIALFFDPPCEN